MNSALLSVGVTIKIVAKAAPTQSSHPLLVGVRSRTSFFGFCEEKIVAKATPTQSGHPLLVGVRSRTSFWAYSDKKIMAKATPTQSDHRCW